MLVSGSSVSTISTTTVTSIAGNKTTFNGHSSYQQAGFGFSSNLSSRTYNKYGWVGSEKHGVIYTSSGVYNWVSLASHKLDHEQRRWTSAQRGCNATQGTGSMIGTNDPNPSYHWNGNIFKGAGHYPSNTSGLYIPLQTVTNNGVTFSWRSNFDAQEINATLGTSDVSASGGKEFNLYIFNIAAGTTKWTTPGTSGNCAIFIPDDDDDDD